MKKISLTIVALLSLAVLTACGHNSVSTTSPEVIETTEEGKHPDWDPTYTLLEYSGVKQESAKTIQDNELEYQSEIGEKRFEHWVVFDSRNVNCGAHVITVDGMPFQVVGYDLYDPSISLQEYLNGSEYAVWDLRSVQDTETDEVFEWLYYTYEENSFNTTVDNYWNFVE